MIKYTYFFVLILFINPLFAENKIVCLISPPRSLSVAFLRMMEARKDFAILHEPAEWAYDIPRYYDYTKEWFYEDAPQTFETVKEQIFTLAQKSNVFVKEISFVLQDFLLNDEQFVRNKNVHFVFLIRNPHHTTISFYQKVLRCIDGFSDLVGYKATYEIFNYVKKISSNIPYIILSEDLYQEPSKTIKLFCQHLDIPYKEEALYWQDLGEDFTGKSEWHEIKRPNFTQHWHGDAIRSSCFTVPHQYALDENGLPTFEEITHIQNRQICKKAYEENLPYYHLMLKEASHYLK